MKDVKKLNEITSEILGCESEIETLDYKIKEIEKDGSRINARLELEVNGNKRSTQYFYLSKEDVLPVLKKAMSGAKDRLLEFKKQFENL